MWNVECAVQFSTVEVATACMVLSSTLDVVFCLSFNTAYVCSAVMAKRCLFLIHAMCLPSLLGSDKIYLYSWPQYPVEVKRTNIQVAKCILHIVDGVVPPPSLMPLADSWWADYYKQNPEALAALQSRSSFVAEALNAVGTPSNAAPAAAGGGAPDPVYFSGSADGSALVASGAAINQTQPSETVSQGTPASNGAERRKVVRMAAGVLLLVVWLQGMG